MPESLFGVALHPVAVSQRRATDTAAPAPLPVPVYYFHSFDRPFCQQATCSCHRHQQEAVRLLVSILEGRLDLEPTALLGKDGKEGRA